MLPRQLRLRTDRDYQRVFRGSRPVRGIALTVRLAPNGLAYPRYGFVVAGTVSKRAVVRNLIKRRLRHVVARQPLKPGLDLVVIVNKKALDSTYASLQQEVLSLINQATTHAPARRGNYHRLPKNPLPRPRVA